MTVTTACMGFYPDGDVLYALLNPDCPKGQENFHEHYQPPEDQERACGQKKRIVT